MATYSLGLLFAVLVCTCALNALAAHDLADQSMSMVARHEQWMSKYGRVYMDDAEKARRFEVFKANVAFIESVNARNHKFWLEANRFADLTDDEFRASRTGYKKPASKGWTTGFRSANVSLDDLPASVDWRTKGAVTPIKDQGECGCCWAFSTVASMEGVVKQSTGKLISLSEQELVDCDVNGMDQGCEGGEMDDAFQFIIDNGGLTTETNYPYTASDGSCNSNKESNEAASIKGYEDVPVNDEESLRKAVANQPVSVAVDGGDSHFRFYKGGILSGACGTELDHGIAAVGYGVASDGTKYWLMKNSWGTSWGEDGYIRMERDVSDQEGMCGLAMQPSYPTA
ncbi:senescence-specific cysteine protease SAG39-like [Phragmites australis]|uniref:senescence-specific cysteine protease SAG39-like n=1 Tax=Phragmites australis TaxID=29695 RepID=UPI002D769CE3|nr:senescence-specific cysteine protease SAG39-like [Phragmites australis]